MIRRIPRSALRFSVSAMALAVALTGFTLPASAASLTEALVDTYETNPVLLAERARQRATDEEVALAISGWRPSVTASGSMTEDDEDKPTAGQTDSWSTSITVSQPIFSGGRTLAEFLQAKAVVRAGRATLLSVTQGVLLDAVSAYMDTVRDEAVVSLSENQVTVLKRQLQATQDRFEVGELTRTDVAQAEARLKAAESSLTTARAQLAASRAAYGRIIGKEPQDLERNPSLPPVPENQESAIQTGMVYSPTLIAARENEIASDYGTAVAYSALLPTVDAEVTYSQSETDPDGLGLPVKREGTTARGVATWRLYQGGAEYASIRAARQTHSRFLLLAADAERGVTEGVTNAWESLLAAKDLIRSNQEQVKASEIALEGVQQEAEVGARTTLDVLNAEQELLNARVALIRAERDAVVAAYALLAAMGQLDAPNLGLATEAYDPVDNYNGVWWLPIGFGSGE